MTNLPTVELPPTAGQPPPRPPTKHGRRWWIGWMAGLIALAVAISLSLYFALRGDSAKPTATGPSTSPSATTSAPAVILPSAVPSASASGNASHAPSATAKAAPDGRIPVDVLKNATLLIPRWPHDILASGSLKFTNGTYSDPSGDGAKSITILRIIYGDVDRDGATETVAAITGGLASGGEQLLAFDRNYAGQIITRAVVLSTIGPIRQFDTTNFSIASPGVVSVQVADYVGCCGDQTKPQWQWRSYGWNGNGFGQVAGPTAFPVNPQVTETALSTGDLALVRAADGTRHGTLTVTVRYRYGALPDHLMIVFNLTPDLQREGPWPPGGVYYGSPAVNEPCPATGASATYTFAFSEKSVSGSTPQLGVQLLGVDKKGKSLSDADPFDNYASVNLRMVG